MKRIFAGMLMLALALAFACADAGAQQNTATTTANANARIITAIDITRTAHLNFGDVVAGGTPGTVVLTAGATPARSSTGGVTLGNSTTVSDAIFTVSGEPLSTYAITLPGSAVTITSGGNDMTVDTFTSSPNATGALDGGGTQTLYVGATLHVAANQPNGQYSGTFSVTVTYN